MDELDSSPHFQKFIDSVKARGAFKNVTEGTPEYDALYERAKAKYKAVQAAKAPVADAADAPAASDADSIADGFKEQGNQALKAGDNEMALDMYSKAIETSGEGQNAHVYYCNRAAVHSKMENYTAMVEDCNCSLAISPEYIKAHSRLAQALLALERYDEARETCANTLRLDPTNTVAASTLKAIKAKTAKTGLTEAEQIAAMSSAGGSDGNGFGLAGGGGGGMPDMASMMAAMGGGGGAAGGAAGGMPDIAGMMAQMGAGGAGGSPGGGGGMPDLSGMMAAMGGGGGMPDLSSIMAGMGGGGGGGGMPDMAAMMQNPQMMQAAQQMMQNPQMAQMAQQMMSDPSFIENMGKLGGGGGGGPQ